MWILLGTICSRGQSVYISEVMADNDHSLLDEDGDSPDWIELYNATDSPIGLNGWYLTDDTEKPVQWQFPATNIAAQGFLMVFASDKDRTVAGAELHTNFKLSAGGEEVVLVHPDGTAIEHQITFPDLEKDVSYGYGFMSSGADQVEFVEADTPCRAKIPTAEIANWQTVGFDDSGWLSGNTGVGYETDSGYQGMIGLDVIAMYDVNASVFMRVPFTVEDPSAIATLTLNMKYDDGFIAYINGVQVAVSPQVPPSPQWNSEATTYHRDSSAVFFDPFSLDEHIPTLQSGTNMLAIHGMNYPVDSSDLLFVPKLEATLIDGGIDTFSLGLLAIPTPGAANTLVAYENSVETPVTFPERGFYDAPFQVSVSNVTPGATIRYTLDGSEPTENSAEYTAPVTISSTANFRVRAFAAGWKPSYPRTDTYIFVDDVASQPKTTGSINGQSLEYGMDQDVVDATYYDASNQLVTVQDALKAIPSISLTTDAGNLYDPSRGIYVNAKQKWEVPASVELLNPDGSDGFHINAGLRIRGGASRIGSNPKHAFRLFFRDAYGEGKLKFALFEGEGVDEFKKVDLRSAQNYSWSSGNDSRNTFLRDVFARDSAADMGQAYTRSRYYHLYLNGEYWGLFMTEERPVADFGASYFGGDADDYDVIKTIGRYDPGAYSIEATDGTTNAYYRLYSAAMAGFENNADYFSIMGLDANGEPDPAMEKLLDVENMIDYLLGIYYTAASDNGISWFIGRFAKLNNMYAIYNRVNPDGFKWIQHDCEHSLDTRKTLDMTGPFTNSNFTLAEYFNAQTLHEKLLVNGEYRLKFADRVYKHMYNGGALVRTNCEARLDGRQAQIDRAIVANAARWGSTTLDRDTWVNAAASARAWFARSGERCNEVIGYLDADGLIPSILPPRFSQQGGLVGEGTTISLSEAQLVSSTPYYGAPMAVPGIIDAADFDHGGQGVAYFDTGAGNNGGEYRPGEDVDIQASAIGGYHLGWVDTGEWLKYTVAVASEGDYGIRVKAAAKNNNPASSAYHIEVDGIDATGTVTMDGTGGWENWVDIAAAVGLAEGEQVITLVIEDGGLNVKSIEFVDLGSANLPVATPPALQKTIYYTTDGSDPRAIGGGIAGSVYGSPVAITRPTHLKARCRTSEGEWSALAEETFWTPESPLAVTELMYHAPDGNAHDFIEVKNVSAETVTLKGYKLDNAIDFKFKNAVQTSLAPGGYLVAVDDFDAFRSTYDTNGVNIAGEFSGDFSDGGEKVDLEFRNNDLVSFTYDDARNWPQAADGAGHSLVPLESAMDDQEEGSLDYGGNWRASTYANGSPGFADPVAAATVVINEVTAHTDTGDPVPFDSNDKIELFNPSAMMIDLGGWSLSDDRDNLRAFVIPDGTLIAAGRFIVFDEDDFHPDRVNGFGLNKAGEQVYLSAPARGVVDSIRFKGQENGVAYGRYPDGGANWRTTVPTPAAPNQPVATSVRIREVMYNPLQPGNDYEYIQLENTGTSPVTLENATGDPYRMDGGVEFNFPAGTTLPAGGRLWILSYNPTNTVKLAQFCAAYGLNSAQETFVGGYSGSLSDRGERVALERPQDSDDPLNPLDVSWVVVDELYYFDQSPWPTGADGTGYPLVRLDQAMWSTPSAGDSDADLMPDAWEMDYFDSLEQANPDADGDGQSNLEEHVAGTNPTNATSFFAVEGMAGTSFQWTPAPGRIYSVYWSDDPGQPFVRIASGLTSGEFTDIARPGSSFYCIKVELDDN